MTIDREQWLGVLLACAMCGAVLAEDADETAEAPAPERVEEATPQTEETPAAAEADDEPEPKKTAAAEIFVPSEDISEDFAVPFPVDI